MSLEEILTKEDVVSSINENLDYLVDQIPELQSMFNFPHNHPHHHLDVWNHTLEALSFSTNDFEIRLALLLHDIGKPLSYQDEEVRHFHGHADKSAVVAESILRRLGYEEDFIQEIVYLIKYHDTAITEEEIDNNIELLMKRLHIQECDSKAHNPAYQEKRLRYIETTKELIRGHTMNKDELRKKYLSIRKQIKDKKEKSLEIATAIINDSAYQEASTVAMYYNIGDEVDTFELAFQSLLRGKKVLLPRVEGKDMVFISVNAQTDFKKSKFKIPEPVTGEIVPKELIDLMIVPGVAFDKRGARIGYGSGYYDRYLQGTNINTIGICFEEQITEETIVLDEHDVRLNAVQTERQRYDDVKRFHL